MIKNKLSQKLMVFGITSLFLCTSVVIATSNEAYDNCFARKQIGLYSATKVANMKLSQIKALDDFSVKSSTEINLDDDNEKIRLFYIFDLQPQGYIVVSANSNLPPVIAYSFTDNFWNDVYEDNILLQILKKDKHADETKSYMWVIRNGGFKKNLTLFYYSPLTSNEIFSELLKDFNGYLQTNNYGTFSKVISQNEITPIGCLAHIRQNFYTILKRNKKIGDKSRIIVLCLL